MPRGGKAGGIANCTPVMTDRTLDAMTSGLALAELTENVGTGDATLANDELDEEIIAEAV